MDGINDFLRYHIACNHSLGGFYKNALFMTGLNG
jgi:hypothetical protein